ncbi:hypothetical protein Nepgr_005984 [Nepenthes gracilis]|uniref:Uncharacterized protein n=1 Tax=Nepenthes gracilis TaxID=150966 RepID=A0AAD3S4Q4_NEPGR|nr:hypothetical protein Nepgr_005984 [Nepenthes gracilis]
MTEKSRLELSDEVEALISKGIQISSAAQDTLRTCSKDGDNRCGEAQSGSWADMVVGSEGSGKKPAFSFVEAMARGIWGKEINFWPPVVVIPSNDKDLISNCSGIALVEDRDLCADGSIGVGALDLSNSFSTLENPGGEVQREDLIGLKVKGPDLAPVIPSTKLQLDAPWAVLGDFNTLSSPLEMIRGRFDSSSSRAMDSCIGSCGLEDL